MSLEGWVLGVTDRAELVKIIMKTNGKISGAEEMHEDEAMKYADAIINAGYRRGGNVSTEWGWRRGPRSEVRIVPAAFNAADVYQKLQEDGRTWQGIKYQIVSREVTNWGWVETVSKTEGGKV